MKIQTAIAKNGFKVLHVRQESPLSFILFLVGVGSRHELNAKPGLTHFIEHIMFKPTPKRTSSKQINTEIELLGGYTNAYTSKECTGYHIQVLRENFDQAFEIMSDIIQNGVLNESDIEIEKGNIIEEINMYEDSPSDMVLEYSYQNIYPGQQFGLTELGTKDSVSSITREDIVSYIDRMYLTNNMLVVSAGDFDIEKTVANTERNFNPRKSGTLSLEPAIFSPKEEVSFHKKKDTNQAHVIMSYPGVSIGARERYAFDVLDSILGTGSGSILFDLLREKLGVAYYVSTSSSEFTDTGVFQISFGTALDKTAEAIEETKRELQKLMDSPAVETEILRAKNLLYSYEAMRYENLSYLGETFGYDYLMRGEVEPLEELKERIFDVSSADVMEAARKAFSGVSNITYIANKELL